MQPQPLHICVGKAWGLKTTLPQTPHSAGSLRHWVRRPNAGPKLKQIISIITNRSLTYLIAISRVLLICSKCNSET